MYRVLIVSSNISRFPPVPESESQLEMIDTVNTASLPSQYCMSPLEEEFGGMILVPPATFGRPCGRLVRQTSVPVEVERNMLCKRKNASNDREQHERDTVHRRRVSSLVPLAEMAGTFANFVDDDTFQSKDEDTVMNKENCIHSDKEKVEDDFPFVLVTPDMVSEHDVHAQVGPPKKKKKGRLPMRPSRQKMTICDFKENLYSLEMLSIPIL